MDATAQFLLTVGGILLLGLLTSAIGRRSPGETRDVLPYRLGFEEKADV